MRSRHAAAMGTSDCTETRLGALETRMHCSRYKGSDGLAANGSRQRVTLEWTLVLVVVELSGARYQMPVRAPPHRPAATGCSFCGELGHGVKHRSSSMFADGGSHHLLFGLAIAFFVWFVAPFPCHTLTRCDDKPPALLHRAWLRPSCCRSWPRVLRARLTCPSCRRRLFHIVLTTPTRTLPCDTSSTTAPTGIPSFTVASTSQNMPQYGRPETKTRPGASLCRGCASNPRP